MTQAASSGQVLRGSPAVENLTVSVYRIPTDLPGGDATLTWGATTLVLVEAVAAGVTGLGFTYGSPATAPVVEHELADLVIGHDAFDVPAANDRMSRALRNAGRPGIAAGAVSAVDTALWDLKARLLGLPLLRLLGAARTEVAVYGSGGFTTYDDAQLVEQLRGWTDQGIDRVKIKIGESWGRQEARDLHRTALVRRTVGDTAELYVDANGGYTRKQAIRVAAAMSGLGVTWLEEPVSSDDLTGLREVRDAVTADVAAGEYGYDLPYFARMAASDAVDCLQADVTRCGGIKQEPTLRMAQRLVPVPEAVERPALSVGGAASRWRWPPTRRACTPKRRGDPSAPARPAGPPGCSPRSTTWHSASYGAICRKGPSMRCCWSARHGSATLRRRCRRPVGDGSHSATPRGLVRALPGTRGGAVHHCGGREPCCCLTHSSTECSSSRCTRLLTSPDVPSSWAESKVSFTLTNPLPS